MSLKRGIEFLEYARREVEAQKKASKGGSAELETGSDSVFWKAPTQSESEEQFAAAQTMLGPAASRIPPHLREAIKWAEGMKQEHGMN